MDVEKVGADLGLAVSFEVKRLGQERGYGFIGVPEKEAPSTLPDLQAEAAACARTGRNFRVSRDHCENTIYGSAHRNMAFRFWHDLTHCWSGRGTTLEDELYVGRMHVLRIQDLGYSQDHQDLMWIDTCGQSLYNFVCGEFPKDQMAFARGVVWHIGQGHHPEQAVQRFVKEMYK